MQRLNKVIIFLFLYFWIYNNLEANYSICDWWIVNVSWLDNTEICSNGVLYNDFEKINSFSWKTISADTWFLWSNTIDISKETKYRVWFFGENKTTVIKKLNPSFEIEIWHINNTILSNLHLDNNLSWVVWFFDKNIVTVINKKIPDYSKPLWYLWDIKIIKNDKKIIIKEFRFNNYFKEIIERETKLNFLHYSLKKSEYNIFLVNLLEFLIKNNDLLVNKDDTDFLNYKIKNDKNFKSGLNRLLLDMKNFNKNIKNNPNQSKYIIDYYINN